MRLEQAYTLSPIYLIVLIPHVTKNKMNKKLLVNDNMFIRQGIEMQAAGASLQFGFPIPTLLSQGHI